MSYLDKTALRVVGTRPIRPDGVEKVTGRANFGADMTMPGMLWGRIKRSPHAHARIVSIDTEEARALPGVKAVATRADFPDITPERAHIGAAPHNLRDLSLNCMAKSKVLYEGHPVAAVAATSQLIAEQALDLIEVEYGVLVLPALPLPRLWQALMMTMRRGCVLRTPSAARKKWRSSMNAGRSA